MDGGFDAERSRRGSSRALTIAAFATLIVAPLVPGRADLRHTRGAAEPARGVDRCRAHPAEPSPGPARGVMAGVFGAIVVVASICAGLDLAFGATVDRAFSVDRGLARTRLGFGVSPMPRGSALQSSSWSSSSAVLVAATIVIARAALRVARVAAGSGREGRIGAATVSTVWIVGLLVGAQVMPGAPLAAAAATDALVATSARTGMSVQEQQAFERALEFDDLTLGSDELLGALEGKDVVIAFLESYGRVALEGPSLLGRRGSCSRTRRRSARSGRIRGAERVPHLAHLRRGQLARSRDVAERSMGGLPAEARCADVDGPTRR